MEHELSMSTSTTVTSSVEVSTVPPTSVANTSSSGTSSLPGKSGYLALQRKRDNCDGYTYSRFWFRLEYPRFYYYDEKEVGHIAINTPTFGRHWHSQ
jgi:hypothetical protein